MWGSHAKKLIVHLSVHIGKRILNAWSPEGISEGGVPKRIHRAKVPKATHHGITEKGVKRRSSEGAPLRPLLLWSACIVACKEEIR